MDHIHSLDQGVDFTEGGNPENPEKNPRSTGEANYNNSTHMSSKFFWESTRGCGPGGHPSSYNPARPGLTWNSVVKGANRIRHPCYYSQ